MGTATKTRPAAILKELEARWSKASADWDPVALAALYSDDAMLFGGLGELFAGPRVLDYFEFYKGNILSATLAFHDQHYIELAPDIWLAQGFGSFTLRTAKGGPFEMRQRTSWVFSRQGGEWKIRSHHFSPIPAAPPV